MLTQSLLSDIFSQPKQHLLFIVNKNHTETYKSDWVYKKIKKDN